jgi:PadR family transcriptional regulator AphA
MPQKLPRSVALSPEHILLGLLCQEPMHGYALHQRLCQQLSYAWRISLTQTYNILKRLEQEGCLRGEMEEPSNAPPRRRFHVTPLGEARFAQWLETPGPSNVRAIRIEFLSRLYFARKKSDRLARKLILSQIRHGRQRAQAIRSSLEDLPANRVFDRLALSLRLRQLESTVEWLQECRTTLGL